MKTGFVRVAERGEVKEMEAFRSDRDEIVVSFTMKMRDDSDHQREEAFVLTENQATMLRKIVKKALKDTEES